MECWWRPGRNPKIPFFWKCHFSFYTNSLPEHPNGKDPRKDRAREVSTDMRQNYCFRSPMEPISSWLTSTTWAPDRSTEHTGVPPCSLMFHRVPRCSFVFHRTAFEGLLNVQNVPPCSGTKPVCGTMPDPYDPELSNSYDFFIRLRS